jgi:hypothetical protein
MAGVNLSTPLKLARDEQQLRLIRSRRLIRTLREMPPGPLRDRLTGLIEEVAALLESPGCAEAQADGVPCEDAHKACSECGRILGPLDGLRGRLRG